MNDPVGWSLMLAALVASMLAWGAALRKRTGVALGLLLLATALLRGDLAAHRYLSAWDERYHAVVARNFLDDPTTPVLVAHPLEDVPPSKWTESGVWLHKPPLAPWAIAGSLAVFGISEPAVRVPSLLAALGGVALTFVLARRFFGTAAGLWAAAFHAWHARSGLVAAGLRATDHVDALLCFWVELGAVLAVQAADAFAAERRRAWAWTAATGAAFGLGVLTKDAPALVVPGFFGLLLLRRTPRWSVRLGAPALAVAVGALLFEPWRLYAARAFPEAWAYARGLPARYFLEVVDLQGGPWTFHLENLHRHYGLLAAIPVIAFLLAALVRVRDWLPLVGWAAATYGVFSLAATKMDSYVLIAAPVVFCAHGWFCAGARLPGVTPARGWRWLQRGVAAAVVAFALLQAAREHHPWRPRERNPLWAREARALGAEVRELPGGPWAIFHAPFPTEERFYAPAAYSVRIPDAEGVADARARGYRIAVYGGRDEAASPAATARLAELAADPSVVFLPAPPGTRPYHRVADALREANAALAVVYGARDPAELEAYLDRSWAVAVRDDPRPPPGALARARARGRVLVELRAAGAERAEPGHLVLVVPELARSDGPAPD